MRAVAKHSPDLSQAVVDSNALEMLVPCLEEFDPTVKEAAAWAIGYIAQHTPGTVSFSSFSLFESVTVILIVEISY